MVTPPTRIIPFPFVNLANLSFKKSFSYESFSLINFSSNSLIRFSTFSFCLLFIIVTSFLSIFISSHLAKLFKFISSFVFINLAFVKISISFKTSI